MTSGELVWQRARRCESAACIEVAQDGDDILMRNGKIPDGPILRFTRAEWDAFEGGVRDGDFS